MSQPETETDSTDESHTAQTDPTLEDFAWIMEPDHPEPTAEDLKVLQALHVVSCHNFTEYDPRKEAYVYTRFSNFNLAFFDLDEESEPMPGPLLRDLTENQWEEFVVGCTSVNVISLKVIKSDVGYPIDVFGTVLARDRCDFKCIYLFRRGRNDSQRIHSSEDMLTLTDPSRGFVASPEMYFEINLKIKGDTTSDDKDFSKGVIQFSTDALIPYKQPVARLLSSWRSEVELVCAPVPLPVAATIEVNILNGPLDVPFNGQVTAWTNGNMHNHIILYKCDVDKTAGNMSLIKDDGSIVLSRSFIAVPVPGTAFDLEEEDEDGIVVNVCFVSSNNEDERTVVKLSCPEEETVFSHGCYKLRVKVSWTAIVNRPMSRHLWNRFSSLPRIPWGFRQYGF